MEKNKVEWIKVDCKSIKSLIKNNLAFLSMLVISLFTYSLWIIAFWPANMSPDSMTFWTQATTLKFDNLHPYFFSLFISFLNILWHSPATLIIFQTILFSIIISYFFQYLLKRGAKKHLIFSSFIALLLFFPISLYNTTFWNDILYTYLILLTSIIFIRDTFTKTAEKNLSNFSFIFLLLLTFTITAFRYNGIIYLVIIPGIYFLYKLANAKKASVFLGLLILLFFLHAIPLKNTLRVSNNNKLLSEIPKAKVIGSALKSGVVFSRADQQFLMRVAPKTVWDSYVCQNDYSLFWNKEFDKGFLEEKENLLKWNRIFIWTVTKHPMAVIKDRLCLATNQLAGQNMFFLGIINNQSNLRTKPRTKLHDYLTSLVTWSGKKPQRFIIWSPAIFIFIYLISACYALKRKLFISLGYIFMHTANVGLILLITTSAEYRYLYSLIPSLFFLPSLLSAESCLKKNPKKQRVKLLK